MAGGNGGVSILYGRGPDGSLLSVYEVPNGGACGCTCPDPGCGQPLVAKQGGKYAYSGPDFLDS